MLASEEKPVALVAVGLCWDNWDLSPVLEKHSSSRNKSRRRGSSYYNAVDYNT